MFIPDARCMWVRPSVRFLKGYLKDNPVDAVISTGPPHSMHLIAMKLHDDLGVPWIADFRDPWTGIDFYNDLHLSARSDRKHHRLENEVLVKADRVVAVGRDLADSLSRLGARDVTVITNGYDFNENDIHDVRLSDDFTISHIGIIGSTRNAVTLWKALGELVAENEEFKKKLRLRLIGQVDNTVLLSISQNGLDGNLQHISYIPHDSVMKEQCSSQLLLLLVNDTPNAKGILTGKVFEYLAARRPVLAVGPEDGDTAALLRDTSAGIVIDFHNKEKMKTVIMDFFNKYLNNNLLCHDSSVDGYSRRNLTRDYAVLLNDLIKIRKKDMTDIKNKVLYVANNITTPTRVSNRIIVDIALHLSRYYDIAMVYPKEFVPFPVYKFKKYKYLHSLDKTWYNDGIPVTPIEYYRLPGFSLSFSLLRTAEHDVCRYVEQNGQPALTHAHFVLPDGYFARILKRRYGIPYLVSIRETDVKYINKAFASGCHKSKFEEVLHDADGIIVHNAFQQDFIKSHFGVNSIVIPHAIDDNLLQYRELQPCRDEVVITVVSSMIKRKRLSWVIDAVKEYNGNKKSFLE